MCFFLLLTSGTEQNDLNVTPLLGYLIEQTGKLMFHNLESWYMVLYRTALAEQL